jgi:putative transposase
VRRTDGSGEVPLETYARLQSSEAMPQAVLRRTVRGVSTRDYENVIDLTRDGFGVEKSSVSRDFVRASAAQVKALAERRFDGMHFLVIMIDGVEYAGKTMIVALGITADGTKRVLGLRQGALRSVSRCWRTCKRGAWTRADRCSWCSTAPRPCMRPRSGSGVRTA